MRNKKKIQISNGYKDSWIVIEIKKTQIFGLFLSKITKTTTIFMLLLVDISMVALTLGSHNTLLTGLDFAGCGEGILYEQCNR